MVKKRSKKKYSVYSPLEIHVLKWKRKSLIRNLFQGAILTILGLAVRLVRYLQKKQGRG